MAQLVERPTSAQVTNSRFVGSSPASDSVPTAQSLEPASESVSPSFSLPLPHLCSLCLKNKLILKKEIQEIASRNSNLCAAFGKMSVFSFGF